MSIAIIDYGSGNLRSVQKALEKLGFTAEISSDSGFISKASAVILPGVGAFDPALDELKTKNLLGAIKNEIRSGKPFLGLCLGMQLLFDDSEEGKQKGLGLIGGKVKRFSGDMRSAISGERLKVPHMGWNNIKIRKPSPILKDIPDNSRVYFVHSYYCVPDNGSDLLTASDHGIEFASSIEKDNIFALQFHPEKSGDIGLQILKNFGGLSK